MHFFKKHKTCICIGFFYTTVCGTVLSYIFTLFITGTEYTHIVVDLEYTHIVVDLVLIWKFRIG